jgi:hypothetical protein
LILSGFFEPSLSEASATFSSEPLLPACKGSRALPLAGRLDLIFKPSGTQGYEQDVIVLKEMLKRR